MLKTNSKRILAAVIAFIISAGSCTKDISGRTLEDAATASAQTSSTIASTETEAESTTRHKPVTVRITTTTEAPVSDTTEETEETAVPIDESYSSYKFTEEYNDFISGCVFVGDSICSGLKLYDILPAKSVLAQGNVAARNIFDFKFKLDGDELSILSALVNLKPEYIVFSMGMNDVNITSEEAFCDNYSELLKLTESFLPDAKLIVLSVTPVTTESKFTSNENIDNFNAELKLCLDKSEKWTYVDVTRELKNSANALKTNYNGGDGVHLAPEAYQAILFQLCERMVDGKVYDSEGNVTIITSATTTAPEEETTATKKTKKTQKTKETAAPETTEAEGSEEAETTVPPQE